MLTKKTVLVASVGLSILLIIVNQIGTFKICGGVYHASKCMDILYTIILSLVVIFPICTFSIITYRLREEIFQSWLRFTSWWAPLTILVSFIAINVADGGGGGLGSVMAGWYAGVLVLVLHVFFAVTSLWIIVSNSKYFTTRTK